MVPPELRTEPGREVRLEVPQSDQVIFVPVGEIELLRAEGSYTWVHCADSTRLLVCKCLGNLHARLPSDVFFRCHHAHVVNLGKVASAIRHGGYRVRLISGEVVAVSRRKWCAFMNALGTV